MERLSAIEDRDRAMRRAEAIGGILRELKEGRYFDQLGKSLDVGASCGQGCYALKQEGAGPVYGIEPNEIDVIKAIQWGLMDLGHICPLSAEELPEAYRSGFFGPERFDTVTSFMAYFLDVDCGPDRYESPAAKKAAEKLADFLSILDSIPGQAEASEEKFTGAMESMLQVLAPEGRIILTADASESAPRVFESMGLKYHVHELACSSVESVAYIVQR